MNSSPPPNKVYHQYSQSQPKTYPAMDQSNFNYISIPQNSLNTPNFNGFDAAFSFVPNLNSYSETLSGPESPSFHSHDDTTGDEEPGSFFTSQDAATNSTKSRTMETRKRKPGNRKTPQPQEQILKRRVQNRAAQRSFRERQKEYVHDLEHQVEQLKGEIGKLHANYQELLKAVTSAPRMPQWSAEASPATSLDEFEYSGSVESSSFEPVKAERNLWPSSLENQSLFY